MMLTSTRVALVPLSTMIEMLLLAFLMFGCADIVGMQVLSNLTVTGLVLLLGSCSLLGLGSLFLFQWVLVGSIARILLCV